MADPQHPASVGPRTAVVTLPGSVDVSSARRLGGELGSVLASGVTTVIADMTATTFCDSSGARILVAACEQAAANDIEMRLVVPSAFVLRALALMGLDKLLPVYPTLDGALAHGTYDSKVEDDTDPGALSGPSQMMGSGRERRLP